MSQTFRRVVTENGPDGKARFASDGPPTRVNVFEHVPGLVNAIVWATRPDDTVADAGKHDITEEVTFLAPPGGANLTYVRFPPDSVFASPDFDPVAAGAEQAEKAVGLADLFEPDNPGFHSTPTIDMGVVLEGELWLTLDDGEETRLRAGDFFVQGATRHAWSVRGDQPAAMLAVMLGLPKS
jgi:hypothetical protein